MHVTFHFCCRQHFITHAHQKLICLMQGLVNLKGFLSRFIQVITLYCGCWTIQQASDHLISRFKNQSSMLVEILHVHTHVHHTTCIYIKAYFIKDLSLEFWSGEFCSSGTNFSMKILVHGTIFPENFVPSLKKLFPV